jgi:hypothetical protein
VDLRAGLDGAEKREILQMNIIKMDLKYIGWESVRMDSSGLDRGLWRTFVSTEMNLRIP